MTALRPSDWIGDLADEGDLPALVVRDRGPTRHLILNRPEVNNAINQPITDLLAQALDDFEQQAELRVAIIGAVGRNFCAGMDLRAFLEDGVPRAERGGFAALAQRAASKPIIAAVHGAALAGGFEIALACDLIVASRSARFGLPEVGVGLVAAAGGLIRLPRAVPYGTAMRACLTGEPFDVDTAQRLGLVCDVADDDGALPGLATALAERIAANAPLAVAASKRIVRDSYGASIEQAFTMQRSIADLVQSSADAREGAAAFTQRRRPVWQGR